MESDLHLPLATGEYLDNLAAMHFGEKREAGETDEEFRARLMKLFMRPRAADELLGLIRTFGEQVAACKGLDGQKLRWAQGDAGVTFNKIAAELAAWRASDWVRLADSDWVNIVNAPTVLDPMKDTEEAVRQAVKLTEARLKSLNVGPWCCPNGRAKGVQVCRECAEASAGYLAAMAPGSVLVEQDKEAEPMAPPLNAHLQRIADTLEQAARAAGPHSVARQFIGMAQQELRSLIAPQKENWLERSEPDETDRFAMDLKDSLAYRLGSERTGNLLAARIRVLQQALQDCVSVMEHDLRGLTCIQPELRQAKAALSSAIPLVPCPVCGGEAVHAQDMLARLKIAPDNG